MRTAITLVRTEGGWRLAAGPEKPADKQRHEFNNAGSNWPEGVLEIRFQSNDGPAKTRSKEKSEAVATQTRDAEKRAQFKIDNAAKLAKEADDKTAAEAKAKKKAEADQRAKEVKAKEDSKPKPTTKNQPAATE